MSSTPILLIIDSDQDWRGQHAQLARAREAEFWAWRDQHVHDADLGARLDGYTTEVMASIDCTACGRCCQHMGPQVDEAEIAQLAVGLALTPLQVRERFLRPMWPGAAEDEQTWLLPDPCPLHDGRLCTVYAHRPQICRDFPQAAGATPAERLTLFVETARICPITYNVIALLLAGQAPGAE